MKKIFAVFMVLLITAGFVPQVRAEAVSFTPPFEVNSESAVLFNIDTGQVIYSKNADTQQAPAQLAQIMTAIVCLENCPNLDTVVTCPESVFNEFAEYRDKYPDIFIPVADLEIDEEVSMKTLLYAMMLASSTEAAGTIAYHIGNGSVKGFIEMMNEKAKELGCTNTVFTNAHGLYDPAQITTANDMLKITRYALSLDQFEDIATAQSYEMPASNKHSEPWTITHTNLMTQEDSEYYQSYAKGIKTGYGSETGRAMAVKASQNGISHILILLNAPIDDANGNSWYSHIEDAANLLDWSYNNLSYKALLTTEQEAQEAKVEYSAGDGFVILKPAQEYKILWDNTSSTSLIEQKTIVNEDIKAPIKQGDVLGKIQLIYSGEVLFETDLLASQDIEMSKSKYWISVSKGFFKSKWFGLAILFALILSSVYVSYYIYQYRNMKLARKRAAMAAKAQRRRVPANMQQRRNNPNIQKKYNSSSQQKNRKDR